MAEVKKQQTVEELLAEVAALKAQLSTKDRQLSEAEVAFAAAAAAGPFAGSSEDEVPTGRTTTVRVCLNPAERNEKKQLFKDIEYPTYYYRINLPAGAGVSLMTNGVEYYHGETYELDPDALADMKARVHQCWVHEKSIKGGDENVYRKPQNMRIM
jgi:hypothetical protein